MLISRGAELDADLFFAPATPRRGSRWEGGLLGEVVVGRGGVPHGEAVVVLEVMSIFHAGVLGLLAPRDGVEVRGVEGLGGGQVLARGILQDPLVPGLLVAPGFDLLGS